MLHESSVVFNDSAHGMCQSVEEQAGVFFTSVPWRRVACVAKVFIFSLYSWDARLLYLALAALAVQPCWLKNPICHRKVKTDTEKQTNQNSSSWTVYVCKVLQWSVVGEWIAILGTHSTGVASNLHTSQLEPRPIEIQLSRPAQHHKEGLLRLQKHLLLPFDTQEWLYSYQKTSTSILLLCLISACWHFYCDTAYI